MKYITNSEKDLDNLVKYIFRKFSIKIFMIYGDVGAGKTTLVKNLCKFLGFHDNVFSPSFSLVNEYILPNSIKIFHFDFYRINYEIEALDIGYEEYLYSNNYCFVEWPDRIPNLLPLNYLKIDIVVKENKRNYLIELIQL